MLLLAIAIAIHAGIVAALYLSLKERSDEEMLKRKYRQKPYLAGLAGVLGFYWSPLLYSFYLRTFKPIIFYLFGCGIWFSLFFYHDAIVYSNGTLLSVSALGMSFASMYVAAFSVRNYARRVMHRP